MWVANIRIVYLYLLLFKRTGFEHFFTDIKNHLELASRIFFKQFLKWFSHIKDAFNNLQMCMNQRVLRILVFLHKIKGEKAVRRSAYFVAICMLKNWWLNDTNDDPCVKCRWLKDHCVGGYTGQPSANKDILNKIQFSYK